MKATLDFKLPEEQTEFENCLNGSKWAAICWNFDQFLRNKIKYGHSFTSADEALETMRQELSNKVLEQGLSLEDL